MFSSKFWEVLMNSNTCPRLCPHGLGFYFFCLKYFISPFTIMFFLQFHNSDWKQKLNFVNIHKTSNYRYISIFDELLFVRIFSLINIFFIINFLMENITAESPIASPLGKKMACDQKQSYVDAERIAKCAKKIYKSRFPKFSKKILDITEVRSRIYTTKYVSRENPQAIPYETIRLCDINFPLAESLHPSNMTRLTPNNYYSPFGSLYNFKRITSYQLDLSRMNYHYVIEEKWPQLKNHGFTNLVIILKFIKNFKDEETCKMLHSFENWLNYIYQIDTYFENMLAANPHHKKALEIRHDFKLVAQHNAKIEMFEDHHPEICEILTDLPNALLKKFKRMPFQKFNETFIANCGHHVNTFSHNKILQDMIDVKKIGLDGKFQGFNVLNHFKSSNWVLYIKLLLEFQTDHKVSERLFPKEAQYLEDIYGNVLKYRIKAFKKVYFRYNVLYHETYFVLFQNKQLWV